MADKIPQPSRQESQSEKDEDVPKSLGDYAKKWWELALSVAAAIGSMLVALGVKDEPTVKAVSLSIAIVALAAGAFFGRREWRRNQADQRRRAALESWKQRAPTKSFRGLYSYDKNDVLPGEIRRDASSILAAQIAHEDFRFGVLSGDVGCGKTSVLQSGVSGWLETRGYKVIFVRSPRQLLEDARPEKDDTDEGGPSRLIRQVRLLFRDVSPKQDSGKLVLLIDQFEELLIDFPDAKHMQELGAFLNEPVKGARVRVLCAVRRDYLLDLHGLAPAVPDPLSTKATFRLLNFTEEEAATVIIECAERDGLAGLDAEFVRRLVSDLSHSGRVRPPELQIVCTALGSNLSEQAYRTAGGARGVLSEYTRNTLEICSSPEIGRRILRALCDFEVSPPAKKRPLSEQELGTALGFAGEDAVAHQMLRRVLGQLDAARLVVLIKTKGSIVYSLVHDYLVGPVGLATSDVSTQTEEANRIFKLYLQEFTLDSRIRIPFSRLKFIRASASPELLRSERARELIQRSKMASWILIPASSLVLFLGAAAIAMAMNVHETWAREVVGKHYPPGSENMMVSYGEFEDTVLGGVLWGKPYIRLWDARSAKRLFSEEASVSEFSDSGKFILVGRKGEKKVEAVQMPKGQRFPTPFTAGQLSDSYSKGGISLFNSDGLIVQQEPDGSQLPPGSRVGPSRIRVWSVLSETELGAISGVQMSDPQGGGTYSFHITRAGDRLVMLCVWRGKRVPALWKVKGGSKAEDIVYLVDDVARDVGLEFAVSESGGYVATVENAKERSYVEIWDLKTGALVKSRELSAAMGRRVSWVKFSRDGKYLLIHSVGGVYILDANSLLPVPQIASQAVRRVDVFSEEQADAVVWANGAAALLWKLSQENPYLLPDFYLETAHSLLLHRDGQHLVVRRNSGGVELWELYPARKVRDLYLSASVGYVSFAIQGTAIHVGLEGGTSALYRVDTGELITAISDAGDVNPNIFYDENCQRAHLWTQGGLVLRYTLGYRLPVLGFRPRHRCVEDGA